jgi:hypothetical protein
MRAAIVIRSLLFSFVLLAFSHGAFAQIGIGISMAASITATATAVLDMRAAAGKVVTSPTTLT